MAHGIIKKQDKQAQNAIQALLNKNSIVDPEEAVTRHERMLALIKGRNGYTNENARDELEKRLRIYDRMNRSAGIPPSRSNFRHPHTK